jgi:hypothetical protein
MEGGLKNGAQSPCRRFAKGQYFSFDAIAASVIVVLAFSSLLAYWYGMQSVVESRASDPYYDSIRIAESLLSPGSPPDWETRVADTKQIGVAKNFSNELSRQKIEGLQALYSSQGGKEKVNRLLRVGGSTMHYQIAIVQTDALSGQVKFIIGEAPLSNATLVAVAHRGGSLEGHPMHITVTLWR